MRRQPAWWALLVGLVVALPLLAGCGSSTNSGKSGNTISLEVLPALPAPAVLNRYHLFVTDLLSGNVAELGIKTYHVAESVHGLGLAPNGKTLYVTDTSDGRLVAYPLHTDGTLGQPQSAPVGSNPVHMAATLDGSTVFVSNFGASSISVIDTHSWTLKKTITVPAEPHGIVLSPDGRYVYAACYAGGAIAVISTATDSLVATIMLPALSEPYGITTSADGRYVYATSNATARLFIVDATTRTLLPSIEVGLRPALISRSPDGATLYVANGASRSVSMVDIATNPAHPSVQTIPLTTGGYPHGIAVTPDGRYVVVANTYGNTLSIIATASHQVIATIAAGQYPNDVLITS